LQKEARVALATPSTIKEPSVECRADKENFALLAPRALVRHVTAPPPIETRAHRGKKVLLGLV
jgi:hypothetical protein